MHDLRVHFQYYTFCHIYRGEESREYERYFIPSHMGWTRKLVGFIGVFDDFCQMSGMGCHFSGAAFRLDIQGARKVHFLVAEPVSVQVFYRGF